jgi:hypothetical protein
MADKYPIQESLTELTQNPDINESSNGSQLETEPGGQSIAINFSLTVEIIETPSMVIKLYFTSFFPILMFYLMTFLNMKICNLKVFLHCVY